MGTIAFRLSGKEIMAVTTSHRGVARGHFLREPALIALQNMRAHKLRSFLMLLGVILSVSTLILVVALISGMNEYFATRIANLGSNVFLVMKFPIISDSKELLKATRRNRDITLGRLRSHCATILSCRRPWAWKCAAPPTSAPSGRAWRTSTCAA